MSKAKKSKTDSEEAESSSLTCDWDLLHVLEDRCQWDRWALKNTVNLLDDDNTVPFIARYRKEQTRNMDAEKIRQVKEQLDNLRVVQAKISSVYKAVEKLKKVTREWKQVLASAQTLSEVEHLYAPFKPGSKRSLAERAKELGLEPLAMSVLNEPWAVNLQAAVKPNVEGLSTTKEVEKGIQHILADIISKHKDIMEAVRECCKTSNVLLTSKKMNSKDADIKDSQKFELYNDFKIPIRHIKPHQVLAINRGVSKKLLSMKIVIPDSVERRVQYLGQQKFFHPRGNDCIQQLVKTSIQDSYSRLIEPLMVRHFKSELTKTAEEASIEVFASNLKRLLLMPPIRGKVVLGVDPGFKHGCKYAVISVTGQVLDTGVFYPHSNQSYKYKEVDKIKATIVKNRCDTVAIGNGTACRETETFFSDHIKRGTFSPVQVKFCIVNEAGASIYSASPEAIKELPDMDVSLRGAVSIARRLQDPMAELVKIEHKHLGVGMYQHDIAENRLKTSLDGVVEDCVSFVGVDINVASETLLKHIAGLTSAVAKKIISQREEKGPFINREQLTTIKGLGPKTYKQCAGFVRVLPQTRGNADQSNEVEAEQAVLPALGTKKRKAAAAKTGAAKSKKAKMAVNLQPNRLDMTSIHPESYDIANRLLELAEVTHANIGAAICNTTIKNFVRAKSLESLAEELDAGVPTLTLIADALQQPIGHDIREEFEKPLFKEGIKQFTDLKAGDKLSGRVTNTVHFGAFVDVGVGRDGLIHSSQMRPNCMKGKKALELGDKVKVTVNSIDVNRKRLGLSLDELIS